MEGKTIMKFIAPSLMHFSAYTRQVDNNTIDDFSNLPRSFHSIIYMNQGNAVYKSSVANFAFTVGDLVYIPAGEMHTIHWKDTKISCSGIYFSFLPATDPLLGRQYLAQRIDIQSPEVIISLIKKIVDLTQNENCPTFEILSAFYGLCDILFMQLPFKSTNKHIHMLLPALNYINEHYKEDFSIRKLADICLLSESYFYHLFKSVMGVTPTYYRNRILIDYAITELQTHRSMSIEQISAEYNISTAYFRKLCKQFTGLPPHKLKYYSPSVQQTVYKI